MFDEWAKKIQATGTAGLQQDAMWNNYAASFYDDRKGQEAVGIAKSNEVNEAIAEEKKRQAAEAARAEAITKAKSEVDALDPKNFKMTPSDDGGYNFYDGAGNAISVNDFARATGARPEELLKDSQNPNDQKFVRDHQVVQNLVNAMVNQDSKALGVLRSQYIYKDDKGNTVDPIGSILDQYRGKTPQDLIKDFKNHWGSMYGGNNTTVDGQTPRMLGEARRGAGDLTDEEKAGILSSSYEDVAAPMNANTPEPGWWEGIARNALNIAPFAAGAAGLPGIAYQGMAATGNDPLAKYRDTLNQRNKAWEDEQQRRKTNPWLMSLYGDK